MWKWTYMKQCMLASVLSARCCILIEPYMVNNLVGNATVVLQDIEVLGTASLGDLLCDGLLKRHPLASSVHHQPSILA